MDPDTKLGIRAWIICMALIIITLAIVRGCAHARDLDGRYAAQNPELHDWFEGLRSGKGPCCSDADGSAISDADWIGTKDPDRPYKVRIDDQWIPVEATAVITEPNRVGRTMVWPIRGYLGISVRCFMPGSMG